MRKLTKIEKLYFFPSEAYLRSGGFDLGNPNEDNKTQETILKQFAKETNDITDTSKEDFTKYFTVSNSLVSKLMMYESIEFSKNGENSIETFNNKGVSYGKDINGRSVGILIETGEICYFEENGAQSSAKVIWLNDAIGKYVTLDGKKKYEQEMKAFWHKIKQSKEGDQEKGFLHVLKLLNSTDILVDNYGYYISDKDVPKEDAIRLSIYLLSFFAFRQRRVKLVNIKIPNDIIEKKYTKIEFLENFNKEISIALMIPVLASSPKKLSKNIKKFLQTEDGISISFILNRKLKYHSNDDLLPTKDILLLM